MSNDSNLTGQSTDCPVCKNEGYFYVRLILPGQIRVCPKKCSCQVLTHTEVDVLNGMLCQGNKTILRFPIEKTSLRTGFIQKDSKILDFIK